MYVQIKFGRLVRLGCKQQKQLGYSSAHKHHYMNELFNYCTITLNTKNSLQPVLINLDLVLPQVSEPRSELGDCVNGDGETRSAFGLKFFTPKN